MRLHVLPCLFIFFILGCTQLEDIRELAFDSFEVQLKEQIFFKDFLASNSNFSRSIEVKSGKLNFCNSSFDGSVLVLTYSGLISELAVVYNISTSQDNLPNYSLLCYSSINIPQNALQSIGTVDPLPLENSDIVDAFIESESVSACNISCSFDSDCDDGNSSSSDICNLAGTCNSYCSYTPIDISDELIIVPANESVSETSNVTANETNGTVPEINETIAVRSCVDDDGEDYYIRDEVNAVVPRGEAGLVYHWDHCQNISYLLEGVCDGVNGISKPIFCEFGCEFGVCLKYKNETITPVYFPTPGSVEEGYSCSDSDGGKEYYRLGIINATLPQGVSGLTYNLDHCYGSVLNEGYCEGLRGNIAKYTCPNGCSNGVCLPPPTSVNQSLD